MTNITLNIDDEVIKKVKKIAIDRNSTMTAMIREYLETLAAHEDIDRERQLQELENSFSELSRNMGTRNWKREGLYRSYQCYFRKP